MEATKLQLKSGPACFCGKSEEKFDSGPGGRRQHFDGIFCRDFGPGLGGWELGGVVTWGCCC